MTAGGPALRDIHLPPAAWWPLAPGWWIVAALALLVIGTAAWALWRHRRRSLYRAALREVDSLAAAYARDCDDARLADGASRLLRRIARVVAPDAAGLSGDPWRTFLHGFARDRDTREALDGLMAARYLPQPKLDAAALLAALRAWCGNALRNPRPAGAVRARRRFAPRSDVATGDSAPRPGAAA